MARRTGWRNFPLDDFAKCPNVLPTAYPIKCSSMQHLVELRSGEIPPSARQPLLTQNSPTVKARQLPKLANSIFWWDISWQLFCIIQKALSNGLSFSFISTFFDHRSYFDQVLWIHCFLKFFVFASAESGT